MWIDRKVYESLMIDNAKLREESRVLNQSIVTAQSTAEWLMIRTTQLERERAILVNNFMGVKLEVPDYRPVQTQRDAPTNVPNMIGGMGFHDMGDDAAAQLGITWDPTGAALPPK